MIENDEEVEFERRRKAAWKSVYQDTGASTGGANTGQTKKKLTEAERQQQIKGLSKAFVRPGSGWAKVDPVHVVDDGEADSDTNSEDEEEMEKEDLVAMMRAKMKGLHQHTKREGQSIPQAKMADDPSNTKSDRNSTTANQSYLSNESPKKDGIEALHRLLAIAHSRGMEYALKWAHDQVLDHRSSDLVDDIPHSSPTLASSSSVFSLPVPLRLIPFNTPKAVDNERKHYLHFFEAAQCTPYEYSTSSSILFVIRRPYGLESRPGLFERISEHPVDHYKRKAHISTPSSLEVAVVFKPNFVAMLLYGDQSVRYRSSPTETRFQVGDMTTMPLGTLDYVDENGKPTLLSLDNMAQQALLLRQQYVITTTTTAMGLFKKSFTTDNENKTLSFSVDVGVDTSDLISMKTKAIGTNTTYQGWYYPSLTHLLWWIRKKLPHIFPNRRLILLAFGMVLALCGVLYWITMNQYIHNDASKPESVLNKVTRELKL